MKQHFFDEKRMTGGMILDDELFRGVVRLSSNELPYHQPKKLSLSMGRNEYEICRPVVAVGEHIDQYAMAGVRDTGILEETHIIRSDFSGTVIDIRSELIGFKKYETFIDLCVDENDVLAAVWNYSMQKIEEKRRLLTYSGIPGINHILYEGNLPRRCSYLILNAVEDDPSQGYNSYMLLTHSGNVLYGLKSLLMIVRADFVWIVVSERQTTVMNVIKAAAGRYFESDILERFSITTVTDRYPLSDAVLENTCLRERLNGETWVITHMNQVLGTYNMIYEGKPWTRKNVMIGGCLPVNGVYECSIGTRIADIPELTEYSGSAWMKSSGVLIEGGLMAGHTVDPEKAVIDAHNDQLLLLPRIVEYERPCMACHLCERVCPQSLNPSESNEIKDREHCVQCGLCSYVCPSRRRLTEYMHRGRPKPVKKDSHYIELPQMLEGMQSAIITGYSAPYIRKATVPFTCILSPFKVQ